MIYAPQATEDALDLLAKMVQFDPSRRPSAEQCLAHPYFTNSPAPTPPSQLPKPPLREDNPLAAPGPRPTAKVARPAAASGASGGDPAAKRARTGSVAAAAGSGGGGSAGPPAAAAAAALDSEALGKFSPRYAQPVKS